MPDALRQRPDSGMAQPRRTLSVRVRLMILAVIAIVPLLLERIYSEEFDRNERIEAVDSGDFVLSDYFVGTRIITSLITLALAQRGPNNAAEPVALSRVS